LKQGQLHAGPVSLCEQVEKVIPANRFTAFSVTMITVPSPPDLPPGRISPCDGTGVTRYMLSPGT
jgi:hypothetical protein